MSQEDSVVTRREFLMRSGQLGCVVSVLGPSAVGAMIRERSFDANGVADATALQDATPLYSGMHWRMLGPFRGGRVAAVTGVPGRTNEFYFGAVNGGVWKSIDAGRVWTPVFDSQPVASIGAIAVAPSAPDTVYVGSGESTLRDSMGFGNGVYKSTDAGKTWTHVGLDDTQHIGKRRRRSEESERRVRRRDRPSLCGEPRARCLPHARRRQDVEEGAVQERRCRRRRRRDRSDELEHRVCRPMECATPTLVHVLADERPRRRHLQVDGRRRDVEAADERSPEGGHRTHRHRGRAEQSSTRCTRSSDCLVARFRTGAARRRPRRRHGRGGGGGGAPGQGGFFRSDDAGATWKHMSGDKRSGDAAGTSRRSPSTRRTPTSSTCRTSPSRARRTAARRGSRSAARPAATTIIRRGCRPTTRTR